MILTKQNFELYAAQNYKNNSCQSVEEFREDLYNTIRVLKINFTKHTKNGSALKERFLLNNLVSFFNVFPNSHAGAELLFFSIPRCHWFLLKTFLVYLDRCPERVFIDEHIHIVSGIPTDEKLLDSLKKL